MEYTGSYNEIDGKCNFKPTKVGEWLDEMNCVLYVGVVTFVWRGNGGELT